MNERAARAASRPRRRWRRWHRSRWLLLVVALGLVARLVRLAVDFPIWGDEAAVACSFLSRDLRGLLQPLEFEMVAPIGWLAPTFGLSKLLSPEPWVLRLPALVAGSAALVVFACFARRAVGRGGGLAAAALFAASYYLVRHSAEVKPYAFDLLFGVGITASAWRLLRWIDDRGAWAAFGALCAAAVWCSYPAAFVASGALLALGVVALHERRRGAIVAWLLAGAAVAASFIAMYALFGREQQWTEERLADARHWDDHFLPLSQPWLWPWWLLKELTGNLLAYPNGGPRFGSSATFLLAVAGGVSLWRSGRRRELLLLTAPLLPMLVASALRKYPFGGSARIALHLSVPVCLLAARGLVAARGARFVAPAMALWLAVTIGRDVAHPFKTEQDVKNRAAIAWLRDASSKGDRWIVFGAYEKSDLAPDLRGWRGSSGRLRYCLLLGQRAAGVDLLWAPPPDSLDARAPGRTWLVVYRDNEAPFPEELGSVYRAELASRLGAPAEERRLVLGPASPDPTTGAKREESLTFLRFRTGS